MRCYCAVCGCRNSGYSDGTEEEKVTLLREKLLALSVTNSVITGHVV